MRVCCTFEEEEPYGWSTRQRVDRIAAIVMAMKPIPSRDVIPIIARMHRAAGKLDDWGEMLDGVRDLLRAHMVALGRYHFLSGQGSKLLVVPPNALFQSEYTNWHAIRNPWFIASQEYRNGRVMSGDELLRQDELIRTDFYQRFLSKYQLHHRLCGVLKRSEESTLYLAVYRSDSGPEFDSDDRQTLATVIRHLAPALDNHWALLHLGSLNRLLKSVVDGFAPAIFLVSRDGTLLYASRKATELLDSTHGLQIRNNRIAGGNRVEDRNLLEAIQQVAGQTAVGTSDEAAVKVILLSNGSRNHPLVVSLHPAGSLFCTSSNVHHKAVMLVIKPPYALHQVERCTFARAYRLTHAQTRLTGLLLAGYSLGRAAECMSISDNTARSHLKQIFQKTDTHSQIELVHLHARVCTDYD